MLHSAQMVTQYGVVTGSNLIASGAAGDAERREEESRPRSDPSATEFGDRAGEPRSDRIPLTVRAIRPRDVVAVARLKPLYRFHQPDLQLMAYGPLRWGARSAAPFVGSRKPAFVALAGDRVVGFAQFAAMPPDQRWVMLALGGSLGVYDVEPVWEELLAYAVRNAGLRGVKRLVARIPADLPVGRVLQRRGWHPFATETIYLARDPRPRGGAGRLRRQTQIDTWGVHQLYGSIAPKPVQEAEALTSHRWDVDATPRQRGVNAMAWVADEGNDIFAYIGVRSRGGTHLLDVLIRPEARAALPALLDEAIARLPNRRRVICAVRGYQSELGAAFEQCGFDRVLDQDVLLRYTTATIPAPAHEAFPFHLEVREKLPQRVPTFLQRRLDDGSPG
ncbi:MAG TPA: hypothetical protein VFU81_20620 [Thermomicrobiales bacterium]|nr:hypothetical protein [Thermomicrobiales bacterium]